MEFIKMIANTLMKNAYFLQSQHFIEICRRDIGTFKLRDTIQIISILPQC